MSELDRIAELAVQNERERIYGLLLMHPWRDLTPMKRPPSIAQSRQTALT